jgi:hypothetical protein
MAGLRVLHIVTSFHEWHKSVEEKDTRKWWSWRVYTACGICKYSHTDIYSPPASVLSEYIFTNITRWESPYPNDDRREKYGAEKIPYVTNPYATLRLCKNCLKALSSLNIPAYMKEHVEIVPEYGQHVERTLVRRHVYQETNTNSNY